MSEMSSHPRDLLLPAASLHALGRALEAELGADPAARALQNAGHAAGDAIFAALVAQDDLADLPESEFWQRLDAFFQEHGWGHLHFEAAHAGIGTLESSDWAEADPDAMQIRPSCHMTSGLIANLLGRVAGEEVGVLEVECRSRGDLRCRFLFGGAPALQRVWLALDEEKSVEEALGQLT